MKMKLYTCVSKDTDYIGLNSYMEEWEKMDLIERVHIPMKPDRRYISWVGRIGGLALEPSNVDAISDRYEYVLASQYRSQWKHRPNILPWNFYVRDWVAYKSVKTPSIKNRTTKSIFSGTIRGKEHPRNRWINSTEIFSYKPARTYHRTNGLFRSLEDYYKALANSRFSLCLVGDCPVCQRETESLGLGCVPVFTPGIEWQYAQPLEKDKHFLFVNNREELSNIVANTPMSVCEEISNNAKEYFNKYCSPKGLWNTVLETIEKFNIKVD